MNRRIVAALVALAVLVGISLWLYRGRSAPSTTSAPASSAPPAPSAPGPRRTPPPSPLRLSDGRVDDAAGAEGRAEIEGRVLSTRSGRPIANATLELFGVTASDTLTATDGTFRWTTDKPGLYQLVSLSAAGFVPFAPELGHSPVVFSARLGQRVSGVTLFLSPDNEGDRAAPPRNDRATLAGRVVDERGQPIGGARVTATHKDERRQALSDDDGGFRFTDLPRATFEVAASHPDWAPAVVESVAADRTDLVLRLITGGRIVGRVRAAESGKPIVAFTVVALVKHGAMERGRQHAMSFFDGDGRYSLLTPPGTQCLTVVALGRASSKELCVEVTKGGETPANFELGNGATVRGRVFDRVDKQPIARARVALEGPFGGDDELPLPIIMGTETDEQGNFQLSGVQPGVRSIFVTAEHHHSRVLPGLKLDAESVPPPIEIDLAPTGPDEEPQIESAGINAAVTASGDHLTLTGVTPDGGAARAGLRAGDVVLRVDGVELASFGTMLAAVERMRGPEGSTVVLTVQRPPDTTPFEVTVTRRRVVNR